MKNKRLLRLITCSAALLAVAIWLQGPGQSKNQLHISRMIETPKTGINNSPPIFILTHTASAIAGT
jgi:hypothetical protein